MKNFTTKLCVFITCIIVSVSCDNEYDLDKDMNSNITVGGNNLSIPVGNTEKIVLTDLLDLEDDDVIQALENGNYSISYKDEIEIEDLKIDPVTITGITPTIDPFNFEINDINIDPITLRPNVVSNSFDLGNTSVNVNPARVDISKFVNIPGTSVTGDVKIESGIITSNSKINFTANLGDNIKSIDRIYLGSKDKGVLYNFEIDASSVVSKFTSTTEQRAENVVITFPEGTVIEPANGVGVISANKYTVASQNLTNGKVLLQLYVRSIKASIGVDQPVSFNISNVYVKGTASNAISASSISINSDNMLTFYSADVVTKDITTNVDPNTVNTKIEFDKLEDIAKVISVDFAAGSAINIKITPPAIPAPLVITGGSGMDITFPNNIVFESGIPNFDYATNKFHLSPDDAFGDKSLPIKQLKVDKDVIDDKISMDINVLLSQANFVMGSKSINTSILSGINDLSYESGIGESVLTISTSSIITKAITADINPVTSKIEIKEDIPSEVISIVSAQLAKSNNSYPFANLSVVFTGLPVRVESINLKNFRITFPEIFVFENDPEIEGSVFTSNAKIMRSANGSFIFKKKLYVKEIAFGLDNDYIKDIDGVRTIVIDKDIKIDGSISIPGSSISTDELSDILGTPNVSLTDMQLSVVEGKFDPVIDPVNEVLKFDDLPDFLRGDNVNLDLINPIIKLEVANPIGLPISADAVITPVNKNVPDNSRSVTATLDVAEAEVLGVSTWSRFWLAESDKGVLQGFTYINKDILPLIVKIPDELSVKMNIKAVNNDKQHKIDLTKSYKLEVKYDIDIPLTLGEEFKIEYIDTLKNLGKDISDITDKISQLDLTMAVENSIPLDMGFDVIPADKNEVVIKGLTVVVKGRIAPGIKDDSNSTMGTKVAKSTLEVSIKETSKGQLAKLDQLYLKINADVLSVSVGASLNKNQYLQLNMKAKVPGGITIDLDE